MSNVITESTPSFDQIIAVENRRNFFDVIEATAINESHLPQLQEKINQANVVLLSFDGDGVLFNRYDKSGMLQNMFGEWTDQYKETELKILGAALDQFRQTCEQQGKKLIVSMNTNRETDVVQAVFAHFPESVRGNVLASCEGGHVLHSIENGKIKTMSLPNQDSNLSELKQSLEAELMLKMSLEDKPMGSKAYKPFRQGMITFRGVDPEFVGWDPETKQANGPILEILTKYGYSPDSPFQVAYYPFDGGLDIFFTQYSKLTGEVGIINTAVTQGLIKPGEKVFAAQVGDSYADEISSQGHTPNGVQYDIIDLVVANGHIDLRQKAELATNSATFWGAFESVKTLETMVKNSSKPEILVTWTRGLKGLLKSYLSPENPKPEDFNLVEVVKNLDFNSISKLMSLIQKTQTNDGTIWTIGNGGSYDNAKLIVSLLDKTGVRAKMPGGGQEKVEIAINKGPDQMFSQLLRKNGSNKDDLLIPISGSGNSPNILEAIKTAQEIGMSVFALGGRNGGKMAEMTGIDNSCIVKSDIMEVIEDTHAVLAFILGEVFSSKDFSQTNVEIARKQVVELIKQMTSEKNLDGLAKMLYEIEKTLVTNGRTIFIGSTIGVNHVRADTGRGATNHLPFALNVPENIVSSNSGSATTNDAGAKFVLVHGLQNLNPMPNDLVVILNSPARNEDNSLQLCLDEAQALGCNALVLGDDLPGKNSIVKLDLNQNGFELFTSILADLSGRTLHDHIIKSFNIEVKPFNQEALTPELKSWLVKKLDGDKLLGRKDLLAFEGQLKKKELLPDGKVIVFNYGYMFIADDPALLGFKRSFY